MTDDTRPIAADRATAAPAPTRTWSLYGFRIASEHAFVHHLAPSVGEADLVFRYVRTSPLPDGWNEAPPDYSSPTRIDEHQSFLYVHKLAACTVLRFTEVADFFIQPDRILCRLWDPAYAFMVELHLLGFVMSVWLEERGLPAIHASAVAVGEGAIGFLSTNAGGKSSLAAGFMRAGHPLLTDDIMPIDFSGASGVAVRPSYPQMRMWPEQARHFVGAADDLEKVHPALEKRRVPVGPNGFGTFCDEPRPLARLYVPERCEGGDVEIGELTFAESVFALARYSFLGEIVQALGVNRSRFALFARIARELPIRRVTYPSGIDRLPDVVSTIIADGSDVDRRGS